MSLSFVEDDVHHFHPSTASFQLLTPSLKLFSLFLSSRQQHTTFNFCWSTFSSRQQHTTFNFLLVDVLVPAATHHLQLLLDLVVNGRGLEVGKAIPDDSGMKPGTLSWSGEQFILPLPKELHDRGDFMFPIMSPLSSLSFVIEDLSSLRRCWADVYLFF